MKVAIAGGDETGSSYGETCEEFRNVGVQLAVTSEKSSHIMIFGLFVVLCVCETWSLILWEEHKLRVFENRVLRIIFGLKRDEVMGGWKTLHNEELHDLYSSPSIIRIMKSRRMRWAGHVARMGEKGNVYSLLVGKPEGKRPLGRPRRRWM
jgi:hypothetical protein